jgi:hypothetical protein
VTIDRGTAIDDVLTDGSFQLFPNPGNGRFRVQATALQSSDMQVVVYDMTGREVFASDIIRATELDQEINLHHMAVGTYFVQLRIGAEQVMQKYVLMK